MKKGKKSKKQKKGESFESYLSLRFHRQALPLALSPLFLREKGCGQVDVARFRKGFGVELYEAKSSRAPVSFSQQLRLKRSAQLCSWIFNCSSRIYFIHKEHLPNRPNFL